MSLITRCPACQTLFRVVPDQLRISEGWVRCGQCDEIFDAALHLLPAVPEQAMPLIAPPELAVDLAVQESDLSSHGPANADADDSPLEQQPGVPESVTERVATASLPEEFLPVDEGLSIPMARAVELDPLDTPADLCGPAAEGVGAAPLAHVAQEEREDLEADSSIEFAEVSFLRDGTGGAFWRKPIVRVTLILLSLALLLGLMAQTVLHERDRIAALEPGLRPLLLAMCAPLNCVLSPPRRIESIVIGSSSFTRSKKDSYLLNFTIKNTSDIPLAASAIELTLTDSLDHPVVRRVLLPSELGAKTDTLPAGTEWPIALAMTIKAAGPSDPIAGYRLLAFYP